MFCSNCGKEIAQGNKFCSNCGCEIKTKTIEKGKKQGLTKSLYRKLAIIGGAFVILVFVLLVVFFKEERSEISYVDNENTKANDISASDTSISNTNTNNVDTDSKGLLIEQAQEKILRKTVTREMDGDITSWTEYEYNEFKKLIRKQTFYTDGQEGVKSEYGYDEEQNLVQEVTYAEGNISQWYEYEYDVIGNQIKKIEYDPSGAVLVESEYNSLGKMIAQVCYSAGIYRQERKYDGKGNLLCEMQFSPIDSVDFEWKHEWNYDSEGKESEEIYTNSSGEITYYQTQYECDDEGKVLKATRYNLDGTVVYWSHYSYDDKGNVLEEDIRHYPDGTIVPGFTYVYEYNDSGNMVKKEQYYNGKSYKSFMWEYDEKQNIVKYIVENRSGISGLKQEYDESENLIFEARYAGHEFVNENLMYALEMEYDDWDNMTKEIKFGKGGMELNWTEYIYE